MHAEMMNIFVYMPHLVDIHLASFGVLDKLPESNHFPQRLRHLYLEADVIELDPMPILEKLPCLVVLELSGYEGQIMSCSAQGFPRLQELKLDRFSIKEWRMELGTMPKISHLTLWLCKKMWKLPKGLLHLASLKNLKLISKPLISGDDSTLKELERRGCEVALLCPSRQSFIFFGFTTICGRKLKFTVHIFSVQGTGCSQLSYILTYL
jgi:hypothetical protein